MALRDQSLPDLVAQEEMNDPLPQKRLENRTIYLSRNQFGAEPKHLGRPVITDFGLAVYGDRSRVYNHIIQPDGYRAPEVAIGAGWSYSADMWNLGVLVSRIHFRSSFEIPCNVKLIDFCCSFGSYFKDMVLSMQIQNLEHRHSVLKTIWHG